MHLDHIDAGALSAGCRVAVAFDEFVNFFSGNSLGDFPAARRRNSTGSLQRIPCQLRIAFRTSMLQLDRNFCAVFMTFVSDSAETIYGIVGIQAGLAGSALSFFVYNRRFYRNKAVAAFGTGTVLCNGFTAQGAVRIGKIIAHGRNSEAVGNRHAADCKRRKHGFIRHSCTLSLPCLQQKIFLLLLCTAYPGPYTF